MKKIREDLELICKLFDLGSLIYWEEVEPVKGFRTVIFDSEKESNLKYNFK